VESKSPDPNLPKQVYYQKMENERQNYYNQERSNTQSKHNRSERNPEPQFQQPLWLQQPTKGLNSNAVPFLYNPYNNHYYVPVTPNFGGYLNPRAPQFLPQFSSPPPGTQEVHQSEEPK